MQYDITIDPKLYETYPEIRLGCLRFTAQVLPPDDAFWAHLERDVFPSVREAIAGKAWSEIPGIRGSRAAYKAFGRDPGRYRVSSESLIRRVRRGDALYRINTVVDVNNLISVTSGLSVGSYDLAKVQGAVHFRKAEHGEGYHGIGRDFIDLENLLILADDAGVFGSSMSDSTRTMVTETATDILVTLHCFESAIDLPALLDETREAFEKYAGVKNAETWIV